MRLIIIYTAAFLLSFTCYGQGAQFLRLQIDSILLTHKATIGVGILHIELGDTLTINNAHHYPTQSVYKFPLAMCILDMVDNNKLSLLQKVHLTPTDLRPKTWSPMRDKYPDGHADVSVNELLEYTVSKSDNNTCDVLFKLAGGATKVHKYIQALESRNMTIATTEYEMAQSWQVQYTNWTQPYAMVQLLYILYQGAALSPQSNALLLRLMTETINSPNRIMGMLPEGTVVAHKTGTSGTNKQGMMAAVNDAGIITLPNGKHIAIAVFVTDSYEPLAANEKAIAEIAKVVYDYYSGK